MEANHSCGQYYKRQYNRNLWHLRRNFYATNSGVAIYNDGVVNYNTGGVNLRAIVSNTAIYDAIVVSFIIKATGVI